MATAGRVLVLTLLLVSLPGRASTQVGTFAKSVTAAPPTQDQVIPHALGETPKALILWTSGQSTEAFGPGYLFGLGFSDGLTSVAQATASQHGVTSANSSERMANAALTLIRWGEVPVAEATLKGWDASSFTLSWARNDTSPVLVHFLAVGGAAVRAKVLTWQLMQGSTQRTVAGVGFRPDALLHAHTYQLGSFNGANFTLGVADSGGAQWSLGTWSRDGISSADTQRQQQTDSCLISPTESLTVGLRAQHQAMTADGFSLNVPTALYTGDFATLALAGVQVRAGAFAKSTAAAPAAQVVGMLGLRPEAVLLASDQGAAAQNPVPDTLLGLGAASAPAAQAAIALFDQDLASPTSVGARPNAGKAFLRASGPAVTAEADLVSFDPDGFTLRWTTNDAVAAQVAFLALSTLPLVVDAGVPDAGQADGGAPDGAAGVPDAAGPADAGERDPLHLSVGCGCGSLSVGAPAALLGLLLLAAARRGGRRGEGR